MCSTPANFGQVHGINFQTLNGWPLLLQKTCLPTSNTLGFKPLHIANLDAYKWSKCYESCHISGRGRYKVKPTLSMGDRSKKMSLTRWQAIAIHKCPNSKNICRFLLTLILRHFMMRIRVCQVTLHWSSKVQVVQSNLQIFKNWISPSAHATWRQKGR